MSDSGTCLCLGDKQGISGQSEVTCPSLKWGEMTLAFSEGLGGVLYPREAGHTWAEQLPGDQGLISVTVHSWMMLSVSWPCSISPGAPCWGGTGKQRGRGEEACRSEPGLRGRSRAAARAEVPPNCVWDVFCFTHSPLWYQHLMVAPKGAPPGRTSKPPVCIQWFLWNVCGKLCQRNGL